MAKRAHEHRIDAAPAPPPPPPAAAPLPAAPPPPPPARTPSPADEILRAVRTRWPVIVIAMVAGALAAWLIGSMQPKRYRASSVVAVIPRADGLAADDQIRGIQALDQRTIVATIAALPSMPGVTDAVAADYSVRAVVLPNTNLLRVDVDGADATRAAAIANQVPAILAQRTRAIFSLYGVVTVSTATSGELIFPRIDRIVAGGLVVGLILGVTLAWMLASRKP